LPQSIGSGFSLDNKHCFTALNCRLHFGIFVDGDEVADFLGTTFDPLAIAPMFSPVFFLTVTIIDSGRPD
jgi:hypothetical protein